VQLAVPEGSGYGSAWIEKDLHMSDRPLNPPPSRPPKKPYERPRVVKVQAIDTATLFMAVSPMMMMH
jgi:hypothetical protein